MSALLLPVGMTRLTSWADHQRRVPPSTEPGTDFFVPIGTPVIAPADGRVYGYGTSVIPATGRWAGLDLKTGQRFRALHLSEVRVQHDADVRAGQVIGLSGASGYGEEDWSWNIAQTGGAHVHVTLWPTHESRFGYDATGRPYTIDFMEHALIPSAAGSAQEEEEMITILEIKGDSKAGKSLYDVRTGKAIRAISRDENTSFRIAEARGAAVYVSVSATEYKNRGGK